MKPLIDADILRYEIGFAAEQGWQTEEIPPWWYVEEFLLARIEEICERAGGTESYQLYLTGKGNFRDEIAVTKPYKGTRKDNKPWHFNNLTVYMRDVLDAIVVDGIEADDRMTIDHLASEGRTIICSRDKDLRQVPGMFYSWELGRQAEFGPVLIHTPGWISLSPDHKKIIGTGLPFFYSQLLTGDAVDNIPGLPKCGPVRAFEILSGRDGPPDMLKSLCEAYNAHYGDVWEEKLLEQGRLLWMTRRLNEDGSPVLWEIGMTE
jgi:hypothetical protein